MGFWEESKKEMQAKMRRFNEIFDELGLSVCSSYLSISPYFQLF